MNNLLEITIKNLVITYSSAIKEERELAEKELKEICNTLYLIYSILHNSWNFGFCLSISDIPEILYFVLIVTPSTILRH